MKLRLFQFYPSPLCAKIRKILEFKGLAYETVEVDYLDRAELLAASGQIKVPALQLPGGEVLVDSAWIVTRLEALYPEPTVLPPVSRGLHMTLTRFFEDSAGDVLMRLAIPELLEFYRRQGEQQLAFFRLVHDGRYGAGFCDRMDAERESNLRRALEILAPVDEALNEKAFLLGRLGLADFALYGQLWRLGFTGELKIPKSLANLHEFFSRVDCLSAVIEEEKRESRNEK
ncbi:MAG TPA: glutathione S-transferase family protein [Candidatus Binataceae bacterium]|jgi:glutathione S-transferase|nr:glutathione S-transferase family protein [Candidatus Binataceae bacterium]